MAKIMPEQKTPFGVWTECRETVPGVWRLKVTGGLVAYWLSESARVLVPQDVRLEFLSYGEDVYAQDGWYAPGIPVAFVVGYLSAMPHRAKAFPPADLEESDAVLRHKCPAAAARNRLIG